MAHGADCGPTCIALIANTNRDASQYVTVDSLYMTSAVLKNKQSSDITNFSEMIQVVADLGFTLSGKALASQSALETLRDHVRNGKLCIALVNYD